MQQVAAVGVDVHHVGVEGAHPERRAHGHRSISTLAAGAILGRRDRPRAGGREAGDRGLAVELGRRRGRPRRTTSSLTARAGGVGALPAALEHDRSRLGAGRSGWLSKRTPSRSARSGSGRSTSDGLERLERLDERDGAARRRARGAARAQRRKAGAARPPSRWIVCIGTRQRAKRSPSAKCTGVGATQVRDRQAGRRAARERGEQHRVAVERDDRVPGAGEVEGDPAGAGADVEHRARRRRRPARARAAGRRRSRRIRGRARSTLASVMRARPGAGGGAAVGEQRAQLEHRGIGGQGV